MSDLEAYISERDAREPGFRDKVDDAERRAVRRAELGARLRKLRGSRSQTWLAAQMETSESIVRRIERGEDVRLSTLEKYARALGKELSFVLA